jgi:hypothetical protein
MGLGAKDAKGDPQPQMLKLGAFSHQLAMYTTVYFMVIADLLPPVNSCVQLWCYRDIET